MILVTAAEMQEMDRQTIKTHGIPGLELMENAGRGATDVLLDQFAGTIKTGVGIISGKGNNGGDGFVIARYLVDRRIDVTVYLLAKATQVKGDAAANLKRLAALKVPVIEIPDEDSFSKIKSDLCRFDLLVDAILGTGLTSDVRGFFKTVINFINNLNRSGIPVFAVDMPSGLNSDTGQPCGTVRVSVHRERRPSPWQKSVIIPIRVPNIPANCRLSILEFRPLSQKRSTRSNICSLPNASVPHFRFDLRTHTRGKADICWLSPVQPEKPVQPP